MIHGLVERAETALRHSPRLGREIRSDLSSEFHIFTQGQKCIGRFTSTLCAPRPGGRSVTSCMQSRVPLRGSCNNVGVGNREMKNKFLLGLAALSPAAVLAQEQSSAFDTALSSIQAGMTDTIGKIIPVVAVVVVAAIGLWAVPFAWRKLRGGTGR